MSGKTSKSNSYIGLHDHYEIAEEINEIIDRISRLSLKISNAGGKKKTQTISNRLSKHQREISEIRFELENKMLNDFPDAELYTQQRKYREG